ncbi:MAG: Eco57I restriction-modification methylase domain-containing protein [Candidatus Pacebacteria bacterium]|nr:Eco57I restriction-modification methylase domain-containing protein [Candidatus Paceibacterota bacterium]
MQTQNNYNPDVLSCLANLSSDEVFTPPKLANEILDLLPKEIWKDKNATFLDPVCKSGVFLREIAKRLLEGLKDEIPDIEKRINHIYNNQLFGIGITELTSLLSRRSLYCSKFANGKYSIANFSDENGNIFFDKTNHDWQNGRCSFCGASQSEYKREEGLESHAYQFIHNNLPDKIKNMKFDVIIGNPPYQLNVGNTAGNSSKARAIYHDFISQAMKLNPRYLSMIVPSRWMTRSTEGISDEWIDNMLNDKRIKTLHDFVDSKSCFPGVGIEGGVCYFLWERDFSDKCNYFFHRGENSKDISSNEDFLDARGLGIVIRDVKAISIIDKIQRIEKEYFKNSEKNFSGIVSPKDFFTNKEKLTSSWKGYSKNKDSIHNIKYYLNKNIHDNSFGWVKPADVPKNHESIKVNKVYIPAARGGTGELDNLVLGYPFFGESNSVCSQTYLVIGYNPRAHKFTKKECENIISYISTRFFRYLVSIKKKTQNGPRQVYQLVPLQDFSESWTDEKLYKKYKLTKEEIEFIESMIRPMN